MKMTLRGRWWFLIVALLLLIPVGFRCGGWYLTALTPPPPPCPIESLIVDSTVLPEQLDSSGTMEPADRFGVEFIRFSAHNSHNYSFGGVTQTIYREWTEQEAERGYNDFAEAYFYPKRNFFCHDEVVEWEIPLELSYRSDVADRARLGCMVGCTTDPKVCQYIAQYDMYVIWFYAQMSEVITYTEFEHILQEIDSRMAECLNRVPAE